MLIPMGQVIQTLWVKAMRSLLAQGIQALAKPML
jgi:hypothetical protein